MCRPCSRQDSANSRARADDRDAQPADVGEGQEVADEAGDRIRRADRIAGDDEHAVLDAIRQERAPAGGPQVREVAAQLEVAQRVGPVLAHEGARFGVLDRALLVRRRARAKEDHGDRDQRADAEDAQAPGEELERPVEAQRPAGQRQQPERLARAEAQAVLMRRGPVGCGRHREQCRREARDGDDGGAAQRRAQRAALGAHVEGAAPGDQQCGETPAQQRLLDVEALEQVEQPDRQQQRDRKRHRAPPAQREGAGLDEQRHAERDGERVGPGGQPVGGEAGQQVHPLRKVRRQRAEHVDESDGGGQPRRDEGKAVSERGAGGGHDGE